MSEPSSFRGNNMGRSVETVRVEALPQLLRSNPPDVNQSISDRNTFQSSGHKAAPEPAILPSAANHTGRSVAVNHLEQLSSDQDCTREPFNIGSHAPLSGLVPERDDADVHETSISGDCTPAYAPADVRFVDAVPDPDPRSELSQVEEECHDAPNAENWQ